MSNENEHQRYVNLTIAYFQERGITCEDYEVQVSHDPAKRPDLILPDFGTLLEVKTFKRLQQERQEEQRLSQELLAGKVRAYWRPNFFKRFGDDLSLSRKKFRVYPDHHTAVIFYDLHSIFHKQNPEDLLLGQKSLEIAFPKDAPHDAFPVGYDRKERQLRRDKSREIGAVVFHTDRNAFKVFHNRFADTIRRVNPAIFALPADEHFEYIDDSVNPEIKPLERK